MYSAIETVAFGVQTSTEEMPKMTTWWNPHIPDLPISLSNLKNIVIDAGTYDFYELERFLTYAVNAMGQPYLKKHVAVHLYGTREKLHPNLRNNLINLCHRVTVERIK